MCQLLIVDDERLAVEGVVDGVDWDKIGISKLLIAYGPEQAKTIFKKERVDILLCDIEMPEGTGLELLEWVRGRYPDTETIFLTCHADFGYAKQAIALGSLDYLLKPIPYADLEEAVVRARRKIEQASQLNEFSQYGKYWVQHQPVMAERFWLDIMHQVIPAERGAVRQAAEERNIPYAEDMALLPVYVHIRRWHRQNTLRDEKIMEYAIRKSAEEVVLNDSRLGFLITLGEGQMIALLDGKSDLSSGDGIRSACESFVAACKRYFYANAACYIGESGHSWQLAASLQQLKELDKSNVSHDSGVFLLKQAQAVLDGPPLPDMSMWAILLQEGAGDKLVMEAQHYIEEQIGANRLNSELLHRFITDFQQMVYYVLKVKGIQAHQLFSDRLSTELFAASSRAATDAMNWIRHLASRAIDFIAALDHTQSVVDKAKAYISEHIDEDISREAIASHVYLNPDYLTRLFKKETGLSISDYLLQQRMGIAAELMVNTEQSVGAIAAKLGYANFSHFSRMFKKVTGFSPNEYRSRHHNGQS